LVLSLIDTVGFASGATVQNIAATRSWLMYQLQQEGSVTTYFERLFLQPIENPQLELKPALIRAEAQ
jgi:hypothetical protein